MSPLVPGLLAALAVAVLGLRSSPRRLRQALPREVRPAPVRTPGTLSPRLACLLGAAGLGLVLPPALGLPVALGLALAGPRLLSRLEPASARRAREQLRLDAPLLLDLLAACLAGGASLAASAHAVAAGVPGPAGVRLAGVAAALEVGTPPVSAWTLLAPEPDDPLAPASRALCRAAEGGAPVAAAVARLADDARADARAAGEEAARRAGVVAVAPLGLCFLPAFVLLGVVPVVIGLAAPLLSGR